MAYVSEDRFDKFAGRVATLVGYVGLISLDSEHGDGRVKVVFCQSREAAEAGGLSVSEETFIAGQGGMPTLQQIQSDLAEHWDAIAAYLIGKILATTAGQGITVLADPEPDPDPDPATPTLLYDGTFPGSDTAPGSIEDQAAIGPSGQWRDLAGTCWHVRDGFLVAAGLAAQEHTGAGQEAVAQWEGSGPVQDQEVTVEFARTTFPDGNVAPEWSPAVRIQPDGQCYAAQCTPSNAAIVRLAPVGVSGLTGRVGPGGAVLDAGVNVGWNTPEGDLILKLSATGANPTHLRLRIFDKTTEELLLDYAGIDAHPDLQAPGRGGVWAGSSVVASEGDRTAIRRVRVEAWDGAI